MTVPRNPMQPLVIDDRKTVRFKANAIVQYLYDMGAIKMNEIVMAAEQVGFTQDDFEQFYQLIGYSLCGYHELSRVSDESALAASKAALESAGLTTGTVGCRDDGCEVHSGVERK